MFSDWTLYLLGFTTQAKRKHRDDLEYKSRALGSHFTKKDLEFFTASQKMDHINRFLNRIQFCFFIKVKMVNPKTFLENQLLFLKFQTTKS